MTAIRVDLLREPQHVDARLSELSLDRVSLLKVREIALAAGSDANPFHPANAAGTFAYQYGTWALRDHYVGEEWHVDRPGGVEVIRNIKLNLMIAYANVDIACDDERSPRPRSRKGAGAERTASGCLFDSLPHFAPGQGAGRMLYYLMVDEVGAAELSRPLVRNGTFQACVERIYLSDGTDLNRVPRSEDDGGIAQTFDPVVVRK